jgi:CheY-like chemotaxis protein
MVVEDEGIVARDIRNRLTRMGYDVGAVVDSGENALKSALHIRPDLVLMDIMLKGELDGIQTADQLYRQHHIPVVYLTSHADHATVQRAKESQPFGYVMKPFQELDLRTSIEMALAKHASEKCLRQSSLTLQESNDRLEARVIDRTADLQEAFDCLNVEINARKKAQEALRETGGAFGGGSVQEFDNQLANIKQYLDLALGELDESSVATLYLNQVRHAADRATQLARQLMRP